MKNDFNNQKGIKLAIRQRNNIQICEISKILYLRCDGYISTVNLIDSENIKVSKLLKEFERELKEFDFIRVNQSTIVNLAHVKKYTGGSKKELAMMNGIDNWDYSLPDCPNAMPHINDIYINS